MATKTYKARVKLPNGNTQVVEIDAEAASTQRRCWKLSMERATSSPCTATESRGDAQAIRRAFVVHYRADNIDSIVQTVFSASIS
jgi:hypothetical protein